MGVAHIRIVVNATEPRQVVGNDPYEKRIFLRFAESMHTPRGSTKKTQHPRTPNAVYFLVTLVSF